MKYAFYDFGRTAAKGKESTTVYPTRELTINCAFYDFGIHVRFVLSGHDDTSVRPSMCIPNPRASDFGRAWSWLPPLRCLAPMHLILSSKSPVGKQELCGKIPLSLTPVSCKVLSITFDLFYHKRKRTSNRFSDLFVIG